MIFSELRASAYRIAAAVFGVLAVALLVTCLFLRNSADRANVRADAESARAQASEARAQALSRQAAADRVNLAEANKRAAKSAEDKQHAKDQADRTISDLRSGELRLKARLAARTTPDPAGNTAGIADGQGPGLRAADAEFLVRFAEDADNAVIERNEAVEGWAMCRRISETPATPAK